MSTKTGMHPLTLTPDELRSKTYHEKIFLNKWPAYPLAPTTYINVRNSNRYQRHTLLNLWEAWSRQPTASLPNQDLRLALIKTKMGHDLQYFIFFRMRDLPTEIITNIFRLVAWSTSTPDKSVVTRMWLTHVCRQWRTVALADHTLWSAIWFRDKFPFTRSLTFIERAGHAPLDIRINDTSEAEALSDTQMNYLLDRLFPKIRTIRIFIMLCYQWEPILTVLKRIHQALRMGRPLILQRFELHRLGDPFLWPGPNFTPVGHSVTMYPMIGGPMLPKLTYVSVNGIHFDWHSSSISNLTTIDIRRLPLQHAPSASVFRSMLINCPLLEKLALDGAGPNGPPTGLNDSAPIELKHLKILVLANFTPSYVQGVVVHFTASDVRDLTIMNLFRHDYTALYVFLTGRFPEVRIFTMYTLQVERGLGHTAMVKFLGSMAAVRYIRIAVLEPYGLSTFMYDPKTMMPHRELPPLTRTLFRRAGAPNITEADLSLDGEGKKRKKPKPKTYIFPCLEVAEVQSIDKGWLLAWLAGRTAIGMPLKVLYLQGDLSKYEAADYERLNKLVPKLAIIGLGQKTPEEETSLL
ncbi:uncharacterized protein BT62DRAFT_296261 [Guyanagaster necrorhizus]|uniref:F-box domain-containing protein n=1 Tax=Guyanagaster necrorhizus TaxID=856835 RepID=A0A9P8AY57_9AGAR|nr:uncharacterized protein BT62DRAFT_296261 [Guyanagaster necrorhizus MCA 3950]KAG7452298.1 hypothetical protein BT62DRAFT_296261 [Guyanagaster necrorhizus MCA 3950]